MGEKFSKIMRSLWRVSVFVMLYALIIRNSEFEAQWWITFCGGFIAWFSEDF